VYTTWLNAMYPDSNYGDASVCSVSAQVYSKEMMVPPVRAKCASRYHIWYRSGTCVEVGTVIAGGECCIRGLSVCGRQVEDDGVDR
jgi:hypothetical protein